ncbi:MAG: hypothetical protein HKN85_09570 [Gammaproteobacteria bacterium]|nr:hypothetical protein [Gammaproteobacteria bacterium]
MSTSPKPVVNVLVALSCEAKPFVDFFRLSKAGSAPFPFFISSPEADSSAFTLNLVVSGVGVVNVAAACGWLAAQAGSPDGVWLNCGVAGHSTLPIGGIARVVSCTDLVKPRINQRTHYPPLVAKWSGRCVSVTTHAAPCTDYADDSAVDQEASGFFTTARRFASSELVQSLKVISDNRQSDLDQLDSALISQLIAANMAEIDAFISSMVALLPATTENRTARADIAHLHCTTSQLQQYLDLVSKLATIDIDEATVSGKSKSAVSMKNLLNDLRKLQQQTPPNLASQPVVSERHS